MVEAECQGKSDQRLRLRRDGCLTCWTRRCRPAWTEDALFRPESRAAFQRLQALGLYDAIRLRHTQPGIYTFWDYQANGWLRNDGIRIDHLMLSPQAADRLTDAWVETGPRGWDRPSDHTPVWVDLAV